MKVMQLYDIFASLLPTLLSTCSEKLIECRWLLLYLHSLPQVTWCSLITVSYIIVYLFGEADRRHSFREEILSENDARRQSLGIPDADVRLQTKYTLFAHATCTPSSARRRRIPPPNIIALRRRRPIRDSAAAGNFGAAAEKNSVAFFWISRLYAFWLVRHCAMTVR